MSGEVNILIVEDNRSLLCLLISEMKRNGYNAFGVMCSEDVNDSLPEQKIHIAILDINLPEEDGLSLARRLRHTQPGIGIIIISARASPSDRIEGYHSGADLYLPKPFSTDELLAAVAALTRRLSTHAPPLALSGAAPRHEDIVLNVAEQRISYKDNSILLTPISCRILVALARAPGRELEAWQLLASVEELEPDFSRRALENQLSRLRKKFVDLGADPDALRAVRGRGYQLFTPIYLH